MTDITVTREMLCNLDPDEVKALPPMEQQALLNGVAARVGLESILGPEEAERLWQQRQAQLSEFVLPPENIPSGSPTLVRVSGDFDPGLWQVQGHAARFLPVIGDEQMCVTGDPEPDTRYVAVNFDPSLKLARVVGYILGKDVLAYPARP